LKGERRRSGIIAHKKGEEELTVKGEGKREIKSSAEMPRAPQREEKGGGGLPKGKGGQVVIRALLVPSGTERGGKKRKARGEGGESVNNLFKWRAFLKTRVPGLGKRRREKRGPRGRGEENVSTYVFGFNGGHVDGKGPGKGGAQALDSLPNFQTARTGERGEKTEGRRVFKGPISSSLSTTQYEGNWGVVRVAAPKGWEKGRLGEGRGKKKSHAHSVSFCLPRLLEEKKRKKKVHSTEAILGFLASRWPAVILRGEKGRSSREEKRKGKFCLQEPVSSKRKKREGRGKKRTGKKVDWTATPSYLAEPLRRRKQRGEKRLAGGRGEEGGGSSPDGKSFVRPLSGSGQEEKKKQGGPPAFELFQILYFG